MSHDSTKLNPDTINQQADRHLETSADISRQLDQLEREVDSTLNASFSGATQALQSTTDRWINSVKTSVLRHMESMAELIRREATNQGSLDEESMQGILNLPMETGNFLGVPAV